MSNKQNKLVAHLSQAYKEHYVKKTLLLRKENEWCAIRSCNFENCFSEKGIQAERFMEKQKEMPLFYHSCNSKLEAVNCQKQMGTSSYLRNLYCLCSFSKIQSYFVFKQTSQRKFRLLLKALNLLVPFFPLLSSHMEYNPYPDPAHIHKTHTDEI